MTDKTLHDYAGILFDVDMTMTTAARTVSPRLKQVLQQLQQTPLHLGVCTGRPFVSVKTRILPLFPQNALHITAGGSQVLTQDGTVYWERRLSEQICHELCQLGDRHHMSYYIPTADYGYGTPSFIAKYQNLHELIPPLRPIMELTEWTPPHMVFINATAEFLEAIQRRTDITLSISTSSVNFQSVDVTPLGITKAQGVEQWCTAHHITPEQVIGVGDSENDVEFLSLVGHAVAMGNSTENIKAIANRVIGHTDTDGLAVYLDALLKGSPV